ncbi:MAG: corrinoid protein [Thermodesulfobacteriota bacterium]
MGISDGIKTATIEGNRDKTLLLIGQALDAGMQPGDIIQEGLIAGMTVVGERFKSGEIYVPEMLIAARAMKAGLEKLRPLLVGKTVDSLATVVLGTVKGDLHDIGKNLVAIMLEGAGCKVVDIGVDAPPDRFIGAIREHRPEFVGISALLTTTLPTMRETIAAFETAGIRKSVKVLVGGAPVTQKFADEIGADGYAGNAAEVADKIRSLK